MNSRSILKLLTDTLTATAEELFPGGVPANNEMKGRHWNNSKNRELSRLISNRGVLMRSMAHERDNGATKARLDR